MSVVSMCLWLYVCLCFRSLDSICVRSCTLSLALSLALHIQNILVEYAYANVECAMCNVEKWKSGYVSCYKLLPMNTCNVM